jgi:hypothetical protein
LGKPQYQESFGLRAMAEHDHGGAMLDAVNRVLDGKSILTSRERVKHFPSIIEL